MQGVVALTRRGQLWDRFVRAPARFSGVSASLVLLVVLSLVARRGTDIARNIALAVAGLAAVIALGLAVRAFRRKRDLASMVRRVLVPVNPKVGSQALRALALVQGMDGGSSEASATQVLAQLHLERIVSSVSESEVRQCASQRALYYRYAGAVLALVFLATNLFRSREVAEGLNLLATAGERAPLPMHWIERLVITARPPAYLRLKERRVLSGGRTRLPIGTELTLRAVALHQPRQLVVTDGQREEAFASDGAGGWVAHFTVAKDAHLRVAVRFGDRLIVEERATSIIVQIDKPPVVVLQGAPRTQSLAELKRLPLRWAIEDDHGLRQVDLVLKSGSREERRSLSHFESDTTRHQGGTVLRADDEFLKTLFLPTEIRIEARDNYPLGNEAQWGRSEPIVVVPTAVGESERLRYLALTAARAKFVAALAAGEEKPEQAGGTKAWDTALAQLKVALSQRYAGLSVSVGLRSFIEGRVRWLKERAPKQSHEQVLHSLENLVLSLDDALSQLARRDAQSVSKLLSTVADETQVRAQWLAAAERPRSGEEPLEQSVYALEAGALQLVALGRLGQDLGTVAIAALGRISSASSKRDWFHVALAAQHLSERLRRPNPSFGSKGGSSGGGGSGKGSGEGGEPGEGSGQSQEGSSGKGNKGTPGTHSFDQLARQIAELARQHAAAMRTVSQTLREESESEFDSGPTDLRAQAEQLARQLREEVEPLPLPGHLPGTVQATASLAREHSRAMGHGLEGLRLEQALRSGRSARSAFEKALNQTRSNGHLHRRLSAANSTLQSTLRWVEEKVRTQRSNARRQSRTELVGTAAVERQLAGLTAELAKRGQSEDASLPRAVIDRLTQAKGLMRRAARSLGDGQGRVGFEHQRQAQRLLEQANRGETTPPGDAGEDGLGGAPQEPSEGNVPDEGAENPAAKFRRRVLENLSSSKSGNLAPAVQRYAEGLLN